MKPTLRFFNLFIILTIFISFSANSKIYFAESSSSAVIYYMQNDNVNAAVCKTINEQDLQLPIQELLNSKCNSLSDKGITKTDIKTNLPKLKKYMLDIFENTKQAVNNYTVSSNDKMDKSVMIDIIDNQIEIIKSQTDDNIFLYYQIEAKKQTVEKTKNTDLEVHIEKFTILTLKPK